MGNDRPIGVFDSGIGGLTVVKEMLRLMPGEGIVYLGDTARVPYGTRSTETVIRYALEGIRFLLSREIKMLVVACNTVSAVGLDAVGQNSPVPVLGVIEPGASAAASHTKTGRVGVIGTDATIRSGAYQREIRALRGDAEVFEAPCPLFVPIVEEGWIEGDVPRLVAERYLKGMKQNGIDTLVLGCTHYPLLKPVLSEAMGEGVVLIDSATETAERARGMLDAGDAGGGNGSAEFFVTDSPGKFKGLGERFLGRDIPEVQKAELEVFDESGRQTAR